MTHQIQPPPATSVIVTPVLRTLRAVVPARRLGHLEALRVAEQQADLLRDMLSITDDYFPMDQIGRIPHITVSRVDQLPVSGLSFWGNRGWQIHIRAEETSADQRFTTLHEFKHVIDHPYQGACYDARRSIAEAERELVADYFAACVLMPSDRMETAASTAPDRATLERRFGVNRRHLTRRLADLGLASPKPEELGIYISERRTP